MKNHWVDEVNTLLFFMLVFTYFYDILCVCSRFENILVFPWDYGELLLLTSSLLCDGDLLINFKNECYLLEVFLDEVFLTELCLFMNVPEVILILDWSCVQQNWLCKRDHRIQPNKSEPTSSTINVVTLSDRPLCHVCYV